VTDHSNPSPEDEFDRDAAESFQANPDAVTSTSYCITPHEIR